MRSFLNPSAFLACLGFLFLSFTFTASAAEFRSISAPKAVLYDAPSAEASKIFILSQGYPVEIIVNLGAWLKVRDQLGGLSWVEGKNLSNKRTLLVTTKSDIKAAEDSGAALVATVEKDVVLDFVGMAKSGWIKVKHRDGLVGFVQTSDVWGF